MLENLITWIVALAPAFVGLFTAIYGWIFISDRLAELGKQKASGYMKEYVPACVLIYGLALTTGMDNVVKLLAIEGALMITLMVVAWRHESATEHKRG